MKCVKCMDSCFCYLSLKLGAYLICAVFILTSISITAMGIIELIANSSTMSQTVKALLVTMVVSHIFLFFATCSLLYGLCMEKLWPLIVFVLATVIIALDEIAIIVYIIVNSSKLPTADISSAAGQSFILVAVSFAALEVLSLYRTWQEDIREGRGLSTARS